MYIIFTYCYRIHGVLGVVENEKYQVAKVIANQVVAKLCATQQGFRCLCDGWIGH